MMKVRRFVFVACLAIVLFLIALAGCLPKQDFEGIAESHVVPNRAVTGSTKDQYGYAVDRIEFDGAISCFVYVGRGISCVERSR